MCFSINGIGKYALDSVNFLDYPVCRICARYGNHLYSDKLLKDNIYATKSKIKIGSTMSTHINFHI